MATAAELREQQDQVKQFSPEWFKLNAEIEEALAREHHERCKANPLPPVSDEEIALAEYVLSDEYNND